MKRSLPARIVRWVATAILAAAVGSIVAVALFRWLPVPVTAFMIEERFATQVGEPVLRQRHGWIPWSRISRQVAIAVIAAEDQKFLAHDGFDFKQIEIALNDAQRGRRMRGASTITQQVAKNLFLWSGQNWIRKGARGLVHRMDRMALAQATHPRGLPQQRPVRSRHLGRAGGKPALFQQGRFVAHERRGRSSGRRAAEPDAV
jgi:hypothetical protein